MLTYSKNKVTPKFLKQTFLNFFLTFSFLKKKINLFNLFLYFQYYKNLLVLIQKKIYLKIILSKFQIINLFLILQNYLRQFNFFKKFIRKPLNIYRQQLLINLKYKINKLSFNFFLFSSLQQEQLIDLKLNKYKLFIFTLMYNKKLISKNLTKIFHFQKKFILLQKFLTSSETQLLKFKLEEQQIKTLIKYSYKQIIFIKKCNLYFYKKIVYKYFNLLYLNVIKFNPTSFIIILKILKNLSLLSYNKFFNKYLFKQSIFNLSEFLKIFYYFYKNFKKIVRVNLLKNKIKNESFFNSYILIKIVNSLNFLGKKNHIICYLYFICFLFKKLYKQSFIFLIIKIILYFRNPIHIKPFRKSGRLLFYPQAILINRQFILIFTTLSKSFYKQSDQLFINKLLFEFFFLFSKRGFTLSKYYEILILAKKHMEKIYKIKKWWDKILTTKIESQKKFNKKKHYFYYKKLLKTL